MTVYTVNGRTYTSKYAWIPTRMTAGHIVWLSTYYITPNRHGTGVLLDYDEYLLDMSSRG